MTTPSGNPGAVVPGETIEADWGNATAFRTITRFTDTTQRDNYWGNFVVNGNVCWVESEQVLQCYIDGTWYEVILRDTAEDEFLKLTGGTLTGPLVATRIAVSQGVSDVDKAARNIAIGVQPSSAFVGDLWIDTVSNPNLLRRWNGSEWTVLITSAT